MPLEITVLDNDKAGVQFATANNKSPTTLLRSPPARGSAFPRAASAIPRLTIMPNPAVVSQNKRHSSLEFTAQS